MAGGTARGRQRTDSTHVLAAIRDLNRLECAGETLRHALNVLAEVAPDWLLALTPPEWFERYSRRFDDYRFPKAQTERLELAETIGSDHCFPYESSCSPRSQAPSRLHWLQSASHRDLYEVPGTYTVTVSITDNQGATGTGTTTITVENVAPTVGAISIPPTAPLNTSVSASANFTDPGTQDTHTAQWNWGDGTTSAGTVTETNGSGSVTNSHTSASLGADTITLTITDNGGLSGTSQAVVAVIPPKGLAGGKSLGSHL